MHNTDPTPSNETLICSLGPTTTTVNAPMVASTTGRPSAAPIPEQPLDHLQSPILVGVEADMAIGGAKLPFPKPIGFLTRTVQQPVEAPQPCGYRRHQITKGYDSQRSDPATVLIISREDWPAAIRVLRAEQKVLSTCDVANRHRVEGERGVARWLNYRLRRRGKSSPASTRELS
jgi:hypothetical protein